MIVIDTNALLRYFLAEEPGASKVEALLCENEIIFIPDVVFAEIEYILSKGYEKTKEDIEKVFTEIIRNPIFHYNEYLALAFNLYKKSKVGIFDCIIAAISIDKKAKLASFDKKLLKLTDVKSYWTK